MTFLELCQAVALYSGTGDGNKPTTVTGQTGRLALIVNWVQDAWQELQYSRNAWGFMRSDFTSELIGGQAEYTADDLGITDHAQWVQDGVMTIYLETDQAGESFLPWIDYRLWKEQYDRGTPTDTKPTCVAMSPDNKLCFGPKPDTANTYVVRGQYIKAPQELTSDADEPSLPERFHKIIMWKALISLADFDEAATHMQTARRRYGELLFALERDQLHERITIGAPALA
jgi:hypothetical protein